MSVEPLLSVRLISYNHEKFIRKALDSAIAQLTNFPIEIVIGDDFSTDSTLSICLEYQQKFPNKIRVLNRKVGDEYYVNRQRVGMMWNLIDVIKNCRGKYIAILEGDDYWIDPYKLQKQVDYMEARPDCSMTFHDALVLDERTNTTTEYKFDNHPLDFEYVAQCGTVCVTCSIVMRNFFEKLGQGWESKYKIDHATFHYLSLMNGYLHHIEGIMGVYRISGEGIWTSVNAEKQFEWIIRDVKIYLKQFDKRFHRGFRKQLTRKEYDLSILYLDERNFISFIKFQTYAIINSLRSFGPKGTLGLLKHTIKYLLGRIPQKNKASINTKN